MGKPVVRCSLVEQGSSCDRCSGGGSGSEGGDRGGRLGVGTGSYRSGGGGSHGSSTALGQRGVGTAQPSLEGQAWDARAGDAGRGGSRSYESSRRSRSSAGSTEVLLELLCSGETVRARRVVLAMPPCVWQATIQFQPALPEPKQQLGRGMFMGSTVKCGERDKLVEWGLGWGRGGPRPGLGG